MKRKIRTLKDDQRPPRVQRISHSNKEEEEDKQKQLKGVYHPWKNLELILSIQNRNIDIQKKLQLAFDFVESRMNEGGDLDQGETVSIPRLLVFLNDWVQSLLISKAKNQKVEEEGYQAHATSMYLDFRCWKVFKFCLEESLKLHVTLNFSCSLLQVFGFLSEKSLAQLSDASLGSKESSLVCGGFELYSVLPDCMALIFTSHDAALSENLDMWISTVKSALNLALKAIDLQNIDSIDVNNFVMRFACLILGPFSKFLRVHPCRRSGFRDFVDNLLERLLQLVGILGDQIASDSSNTEMTRGLYELAEEVLSLGLFHSVHIDGFLSLHTTEKHLTSHDEKTKDNKILIKSYHRHLFDQLEKIFFDKRLSLSSGVGELLRLLIYKVKSQKGALPTPEGAYPPTVRNTRNSENDFVDNAVKVSLGNITRYSEKSLSSSSISAEMRKSLFDFFVQTVDPLLLEISSNNQADLEAGPALFNAHCTIKHVNSMLATLMHEKVYLRTEDTSEGACFNYLKKAYEIITSFSVKICHLSLATDDRNKREKFNMVGSLAGELILAIGYFLEIEYDVVMNDLVSLWLVVASFLAFGSLMDEKDQCSLQGKVLEFGCKLVNLFRDLRQVDIIVFALCKALRYLVSCHSDKETCFFGSKSCNTSLPREAYAKSVGRLICSQEIRFAICGATKSIPEGQVSGCIRQLTQDISESMEWLKDALSIGSGEKTAQMDSRKCSITQFNLCLEVLGKGLSEIHSLVLGSVTVTIGNSNSVGNATKELVAVIRPSLSYLVQVQPDSLKEFIFSVTGRTGRENDVLESGGSIHWIFLFLFQLYMSSRALFRLAISFVAPNSSSKMSALMGDTASSYSGSDWMDKTDWIDEDYFSWIVKPSASLLTVIQTIQGTYSLDSFTDTAPLIYVLHALALQRLVDLNRQIKSVEYLRQVNDYLFQIKLIDAAGVSLSYKSSTIQESHISALRQEARDLVDFMMRHLSSVPWEKNMLHQNDGWPLEICSLNEKSLLIAIWRIICQNIDIWSRHASKKKLKMFLSHLIQTSVPLAKHGDCDICEPSHPVKVTVQQISLGLLSSCILYEQEFVRRHFASRFCLILEKSVIVLFKGFVSGCDDLRSLPDWQEVFRAIDLLSVRSSSNMEMSCDSSFTIKTNSDLSSMMFPSIGEDLKACQSLLNLLCWMPKQHLSSKCFSYFTIAILNIERHVIDSLLDCHGSLHPQKELLHLLLSCRRTVKCLIEAACEEVEASKSKFLLMVSKGSFLILWLFKSVSAILRVHNRFSEDSMNEVRHMMFSLMDHTSYVFLTLSRNHFLLANHFLVATEKNSTEEANSKNELNTIDAWKSLIDVAEFLKEQTECLSPYLKDGFYCRGKDEAEGDVCHINLNKLSFLLSCVQGFLWGLASTVNAVIAKDSNVKAKRFNWMQEPLSKLVSYINVLAEFINLSSRFLLSERHQWPGISCHAESLPSSDHCIASMVTEELSKISGRDGDTERGKQKHKRGVARSCLASSDTNRETKLAGVRQKIPQSEKEKLLVNVLNRLDSFELQCFNKPLLQSLLKDDNPDAASLLRQLFIASSAVLRLSLQIDSLSFMSSMVPTYVGISQVLLLELVNMDKAPPPFIFVWLDGILKYLEELGNHFPLTDPKLTRNVYSKLINLHLRVKGRCISLQGKRATLASHETESSTKNVNNDIGMYDASLSHKCWDEFNARLRTSFKVFINQPSELHLLSAVQALVRALVGVKEDCKAIYEIQIGSAGGKVSSTVAAGVDFLDLVLEFVSGQKRLNLVKRHMQSLVAGLFNIILHLQSSLIFYGKPSHNEADTYPDAGAVILMCIEVLTRVSGKHALFHMDSYHVGQSLRIPGALFQVFHHLKLSEVQAPNDSLCNEGCNHVASITSLVVDRRFSIDLYAACCRLLYTVLKHHKSECEHCIPLLEDSVSVLLHCLEIVENSSATRIGYFMLQLHEGVKCASFLRRIYEELRQQKDVFGRRCFLFLSNYIQVYSGYGPHKTGIRRDVDEALRPGVYALIDACSADDLQHLHTVFGEGPCRSTLAMLQNDYRLNFQYEGKV